LKAEEDREAEGEVSPSMQVAARSMAQSHLEHQVFKC
jgi:hypothetical protein